MSAVFRFVAIACFIQLGVMACGQESQADAPESKVNCCPAGAVKLTTKELKARVAHQEPITDTNLLWHLRVGRALVAMEIQVGQSGSVECVSYLGGHPMLVGAVMESLKKWKFKPVVVNGKGAVGCGPLVLSVRQGEKGFEAEVLDAIPPRQEQ